jgi:hypothetical protein
LDDLHRPDKTPLFSCGRYTRIQAAPSGDLLILPTHGTKTNKRSRNHQDPVSVPLQPSGSPFCFITRLWAYLAYCEQSGYPNSHYIFALKGPSGTSSKRPRTAALPFATCSRPV